MGNLFGVLGIGFLLGLKHALEPDHIIAVSTIAGKQKSLFYSSLLGVFWGIGHTLTLLGVFLILAITKGSIPKKWGMAFEMGVGVMLIYLGVVSLRTLKLKNIKRESKESKQLFLKSILIGQIHGLAGSAAMTLLVITKGASLSAGGPGSLLPQESSRLPLVIIINLVRVNNDSLTIFSKFLGLSFFLFLH